MITLYPATIHVDGGALAVYSGTPARSVSWALTGPGTLTPLSEYTDHNGQAAARYTPAATGAITITVTAGA